MLVLALKSFSEFTGIQLNFLRLAILGYQGDIITFACSVIDGHGLPAFGDLYDPAQGPFAAAVNKYGLYGGLGKFEFIVYRDASVPAKQENIIAGLRCLKAG
jgi:hypothetical protein